MEFIQVLFTGLAEGGTIALVALGLTLIFGVLGIVNFAHGVLYMVGAYVTFWATTSLGVPYLIAIAIAAVAIAGASVAMALGVFVRFRELSLEGAIASVAAAVAIEDLMTEAVGGNPRTVATPLDHVINAGQLHLAVHRIFIIVVALTLFAALWWFVASTRWGRALRAVQADADTARAQGISQIRAMVVAFAIAGALAGTAGALVAPDQSVVPSMGNTPLLLAFVAIVVGGMGNIMRTLVAALAVGIVQSGVSFYWQPSAATWVSYAVVLLILAIRSKHDLLAHA